MTVKKVLQNKLISLALLLVFFALVISHIVLSTRYLRSAQMSPVSEKEAKELSIETYLHNQSKNAFLRSPQSEFFCETEVMWEYDFTNAEKVVFAPNQCQSVLFVHGDLRSESGRVGVSFFKIKYIDGAWKVIDADRRDISPSQPITQDWVQDAERRLPDNIRHRCIANNCFAPHGVIKKAATHFQVTLPTYPFTTCETTENCTSDSICAVQGYQSQKPNICVKKCETNSECGNAYTCRYQCVHGENGCPESAEKICIPDLLSPDVLKDPHSFVGFEDGEIHRRRMIAQQYPELTEDYEKGSCFARCSVKVIERSKSYFYAFIHHGSGTPQVEATCVRIDGREMTQFTVSKVGEFYSSNIDGSPYTDIDPMTCTVK